MISKRAAFAALAAIAAAVPVHAAVTISTGATQNMNCTGGTCTPTATKAVLNASDLKNYVSQFGNVRVMTTGNGVEANNIVVDAAFATPDSTSLTLDAHGAIKINAAVSVGSGTSELELQSDKGGAVGTLSFGRKGHITFGSVQDIFGINGGIFTLVDSVQDLAGAVAANPSGFYALANSYDASADGTYTGSPISTTFTGTFDGLGNVISNLEIDYQSNTILPAGFFSEVGASGAILDVNLTDVSIQVESSHYAYVGALIGENFGQVQGSSASGAVNGAVREATGGLVAENYGIITESSASVDVSADGSFVGGLVGYNYGKISISFATGDVNGGAYTFSGGLAGWVYGEVSDCYATGSVTGSVEYYIGGLIGIEPGEYSSTAQTSYSTGAVPNPQKHGQYAGGSVGDNVGKHVNTELYWDTTTSGTDIGVGRGRTAGVTGLTTSQLQSGLPPGFKKTIWAENPNINGGFPYLLNNPPPK